MRRFPLTLCLVACTTGSPDPGDGPGKEDVWGKDDRIERHQIASEALQRAARSSVALFKREGFSTWVTEQRDGGELWSVPNPYTLETLMNVCPGERFVDQPVALGCSGTLVADDIVVTAGHCLDAMPCADLHVVLDLAYEEPDGDPMRVVHDIVGSRVYHCAEVLAHETQLVADRPMADYGVFRLDRAVKDRPPVPIAWNDKRTVDASIALIGHPTGLPQKLSPARIAAPQLAGFVSYVADTFSGNSGGGAFDASGRLIAIHHGSSGKLFATAPDRDCQVPVACTPETCDRYPRGYDVATLATKLPPELARRLGFDGPPGS